MKKEEAENLFQLIGQDALGWLAQAKHLKMSADLIRTEVKGVLSRPPALPGIAEKKVAFIQSFMLLMGLAFENLIKGIHIGRDPSLSRTAKVL